MQTIAKQCNITTPTCTRAYRSLMILLWFLAIAGAESAQDQSKRTFKTDRPVCCFGCFYIFLFYKAIFLSRCSCPFFVSFRRFQHLSKPPDHRNFSCPPPPLGVALLDHGLLLFRELRRVEARHRWHEGIAGAPATGDVLSKHFG